MATGLFAVMSFATERVTMTTRIREEYKRQKTEE